MAQGLKLFEAMRLRDGTRLHVIEGDLLPFGAGALCAARGSAKNLILVRMLIDLHRHSVHSTRRAAPPRVTSNMFTPQDQKNRRLKERTPSENHSSQHSSSGSRSFLNIAFTFLLFVFEEVFEEIWGQERSLPV